MLLHRLVLSGIGGGTLREAGTAVSTQELQSWAQFESQYGPLDVGSRLDYWFSLVCMLMVNRTGGWSKGRPATQDDFMPKRALEPKLETSNIGGIDPGLAALIAATGARRSPKEK